MLDKIKNIFFSKTTGKIILGVGIGYTILNGIYQEEIRKKEMERLIEAAVDKRLNQEK